MNEYDLSRKAPYYRAVHNPTEALHELYFPLYTPTCLYRLYRGAHNPT